MQHNRTENNTENTEHRTQTQDNAQPQHTCSAHNFSTYSFDIYTEYVAIKNSNTIELYTISK